VEADLDVDVTHTDAQALVCLIGDLDLATASHKRRLRRTLGVAAFRRSEWSIDQPAEVE